MHLHNYKTTYCVAITNDSEHTYRYMYVECLWDIIVGHLRGLRMFCAQIELCFTATIVKNTSSFGKPKLIQRDNLPTTH